MIDLVSEINFVRFRPEVASCSLSLKAKESMQPWDEVIIKILNNSFIAIPLNFTFSVKSPKLQEVLR